MAVAAGVTAALLALVVETRPSPRRAAPVLAMDGGTRCWSADLSEPSVPAWARLAPAPAPPATPPAIAPEAAALIDSLDGECPPPGIADDGQIGRFEQDFDSCGTGGCVYRVYLTAAATAATGRADGFAGTIEGRCLTRVPGPRGRPADILTTWRLGCCESSETRYRFSRGRYRPYQERRCTDDGCGRWHRPR